MLNKWCLFSLQYCIVSLFGYAACATKSHPWASQRLYNTADHWRLLDAGKLLLLQLSALSWHFMYCYWLGLSVYS